MMPVIEQETEIEHEPSRRRFSGRHMWYWLFYLGTLLAILGWYIDIRGAGVYSRLLDRLTMLALVGHVIQVISAFALLMHPDGRVTTQNDGSVQEDRAGEVEYERHER